MPLPVRPPLQFAVVREDSRLEAGLVAAYRITTHIGTLQSALAQGPFDLVACSNVFDWMADADVTACIDACARALRPGALVCWRQLNNTRDLVARFAPAFRVDADADRALHAAERSLFYERCHVAIRQEN